MKNSKAFLLMTLLLFLIIGCSGCRQDEIINDPTTGEIIITNPSDLQDGIYKTATRHYDERGYGQVLTLSVKNGVVTVVRFKEVNQIGQDRLVAEGPESSWTEISPLNLDSLYFKLYSELLMNQNTSRVNAISGATQTSRTFLLLSQAALNQAIAGDQQTVQLDTTNTYVTRSEIDQEQYQGVLTASFSGETLTKLNYDEINVETGTLKSQNIEPLTDLNYSELFQSYTSQTLANQNLETVSLTENVSPTEKKYLECLNKLKEFRVDFIAP